MFVLQLAALAAGLGGESEREVHWQPTAKGGAVRSTLVVDGEVTEVRWSDGDSFRFLSGPSKGRSSRLKNFNTLEAFGPVHRWGRWSRADLFALAQSSAALAGSEQWRCSTDGSLDGYGRVLVDCPELSERMIREGHAMAYFVDSPADATLLAAQRDAQENHRGMWAKGVVHGVVTSVHSATERRAEPTRESHDLYNRVVDTRTGLAHKRLHQQSYATCTEVCETTDGDVSCMVYVPFERRYRRRPPCLFPTSRVPTSRVPTSRVPTK